MSEQLLCTLTIVQLSNEHSHDAEYTIDGHRIKLVALLILSLSHFVVSATLLAGFQMA